MRKSHAIFVGRILLVWFALLVSSIIAASLIGLGAESREADGPLTGGQAFLAVNGLHAVVLSVIANQSSLRGYRLGVLTLMTLFFAQSFLLMMEAAYFQDSLKISMTFIAAGSLHALIVAGVAGLAAAGLWRGPTGQQLAFPAIRTFPLRLALVTGLYVLFYFGAGYFIAWQASDVQEYYGFGADIALVPLLLFQILRGALWGILATFLARNMAGSVGLRALIVGVTFSILAAAQLFYPSEIMPWEVRLPHLIEVGVSNFVFGVLATWILLFESAPAMDKVYRGQAG